MTYLILVRHGQSEWNAKGLWTGWRDIPLTEKGAAEARRAGEALRDISVDRAHVSALTRAQQTLRHIEEAVGREIDTVVDPALNERDYGTYTGKNKWEVKEEIGDEAFHILRRGWDVGIPEGESLKDVYARVVPYFESRILPDIKAGRNTLVSAHGNSLRALVKYLEGISDEKIPEVEIATGEIVCYRVDEDGKVLGKEVRASGPEKSS